MLGRLTNLRRLFGGEWEITITTRESIANLFDELSKVDIFFEIKKAFSKRSKDANAFCWALIDKLAAQTGIPKDEISRRAIKEIGGVSDTVCVKNVAVDRLRYGWEQNGIGWQTDILPSRIEGCTNVILYYGSSTYDRAQMARLCDLIIQECEQQGIPTLRSEADRLLTKWGEKKDKEGETDVTGDRNP